MVKNEMSYTFKLSISEMKCYELRSNTNQIYFGKFKWNINCNLLPSWILFFYFSLLKSSHSLSLRVSAYVLLALSPCLGEMRKICWWWLNATKSIHSCTSQAKKQSFCPGGFVIRIRTFNLWRLIWYNLIEECNIQAFSNDIT